VDGAVFNILDLSVKQLKTDFPQHELVCALQCAGNRRHTMRTLIKEVDGLDWGDGAVMNCTWSGPRLSDILARAGVNISENSAGHVAFACMQAECQEDSWYGGSIELWRGKNPDAEVILALEVGNPLPSDSVTS
jgi:sulfite oxidase